MSSTDADADRLRAHHQAWIRANREMLIERRDTLIASIRDSFADVSRAGGVSISEARAIDDNESVDACRRARERDKDEHWWEIQLPDADLSGSAMSFMDPIGFHYHVPAYMTYALRCLTFDESKDPPGNCYDSVIWSLEHIGEQMAGWQRRGIDPSSNLGKSDAANRFSRFDSGQIRCVAQFLMFENLLGEPDPEPVSLGRQWWFSTLDRTEQAHAATERATSRGLA